MKRFDILTNIVKDHYLVLDILLNNNGWLVLPNTLEWRHKVKTGNLTNVHLDMKPLSIPGENITPHEFDIMLTMSRL